MWIASLLYHVFTIGIIDGGLIIEVLIKDNNHNLLNYYYRQKTAQVAHQPYLISDVFMELTAHEDRGVNVNCLDCWISILQIGNDLSTHNIHI